MVLMRFWIGWLQITISTHTKSHNWNHTKIIS
jgi:hypothetical protein